MQATTDQHGFPTIPCPKCDGKGTIPAYHNNYRGICFKCDGAGKMYPTAAIRRHALAYHQRFKDATTPRGSTSIAYDTTTGEVTYHHGELTPGMVVRRQMWTNDEHGHRIPSDPWRTVATCRRTARVTAQGTAGTTHFLHLDSVVTFTDGTVVAVGSIGWESQPTAELVAEGEKLAAKCRATAARRAGAPGGRLDTDTRRYVEAVRAILANPNLDETGKCVALNRLDREKRTTAASRGVRNRAAGIRSAMLASPFAVTNAKLLAAVADYIDSLTTTKENQP